MENKITAEELKQHLNEYLDKIDAGENVFVEYKGQLYAIQHLVKQENISNKI